jgi:hypothetical protein
MSRELVKILRGIADIAEDNDKPNWALAMRQAAEYIVADLEKSLPEPIGYASTGVLTEIPKTRLVSPHRTEFYCVPLYQEPQLYAEPPASKLTKHDAEMLKCALEKLISVAEKCDSWESFPSKALDEAYAAIDSCSINRAI